MDPLSQYERRKERERTRQATQSRAGRNLESIPPCSDPALLALVSGSLREFCEQCFPRKFRLRWSKDHLEVLERIQSCVNDGLLYALAMPRGSGKSTIVVAAALWALLTGRRRYVAIISADRDASVKLLDGMKIELQTNDTLLALFPEACYPIRKLEGKGNKAIGQLIDGKPTYIEWKGPRIVFATIPGAKCSGAIVEVASVLGRVRGMAFARADGDQARPDMFILDDPQTDRSAKSRSQIKRRLEIINGAVLGLAGPDVSIAGFATVTVIENEDAADQLLNNDLYPDWQGKRYKLIYQWPTNSDLWEQYSVLRAEGMRIDGSIHRATEFYRKHRKAMDEGALVAWPERKLAHELSALQHAYNLRCKTPDTFDAEYQNTPRQASLDVEMLDPIAIEAKQHGFGKCVLPPEANIVTAFIDVQGNLLYWLVIAWETSSFTGWILDYGTWPEQTAKYFHLHSVQKKLSTLYPRCRLEARLRSGLFDLLDRLGSTTYRGPEPISDSLHGVQTIRHSLRVQMIGIDAAWGPSTKIVQAVCLEHPKAAWLMPFIGRGIDATQKPIQEWKAKRGERKGINWIIRPTDGGGIHCLGDTNHWKSFIHAGLNVPLGDPGAISLYRPELRTEHRMIAEHLRAEVPVSVTANGRTVEKWILPPNKPDNHLLDCLSGSAVMASICGAAVADPKTTRVVRRLPAKRRTQLIV